MEDIQIYIYKVPVLIFIHISIHTINKNDNTCSISAKLVCQTCIGWGDFVG